MAKGWRGAGGLSMAEAAYPLAARPGSLTVVGMEPKQIWFPAKRYGWGWGMPCAWQGWVVMALFVVFQVGGAFALMGTARKAPAGRVGWYAAYCFALAGLLIWVCWLKGEKPRWRWGDDE